MTEGPGWLRLGPDPAILAWVFAALPEARCAVAGSAEAWRCGGTWFAGVDALPNGPAGDVAGAALPDTVLDALPWRPDPWHRAQLSTVLPGYPRQGDEAEPAFRYRSLRDAAHVDGLLPIGPARRRMLREPHAFILGLALTEADPGAAPLVVWDGSHIVMRRAFAAVLGAHRAEAWPEVDLTEAYHAARREVFATCTRRTLPLRPGQAVLLHRMLLHGVAPWAEGATADTDGRMIAYFRPELPDLRDWLADDA